MNYTDIQNMMEKRALSVHKGVGMLTNKVRQLQTANPAAYKALGGDDFARELGMEGFRMPTADVMATGTADAVHTGLTRLPKNRAMLREYGQKIRKAEAGVARNNVLNTTKDTPAADLAALKKIETHADKMQYKYPVGLGMTRKFHRLSPATQGFLRGGAKGGLLGGGAYGAYQMGKAAPPEEPYMEPAMKISSDNTLQAYLELHAYCRQTA